MTITGFLIFIAIIGVIMLALLSYAIYLTIKDRQKSKGGNRAREHSKGNLL